MMRPCAMFRITSKSMARNTAAFVEELPSPGGGVVVPELLKGFLKEVGTDGPQVVAEQIAQPEEA